MCYIALVKNNATGVAEELKQVIADKLVHNDDGAFVSTLGNPNSLRTLDNKLAEQVVLSMPLDNLLVHFRIATTGAVTAENIQGWTLNGWVCVHNGWVSKLSGTKTDLESDSLRYFKILSQKLGSERDTTYFNRVIRKVSYKYSFSGRAIMYNAVLDVALLFGDWKLYEYGGAIVFSSAGIWNLGQKVFKEHNGIQFLYDEGIPTGESELDGIYIMDNAKTEAWTIEKIGKLRENETVTYSYGGYGGGYKPATPYIQPAPAPFICKVPIKSPSKDILEGQGELPLPLPPMGEVVGYDAGGNDIIVIDDEIHTASGSCCMAGKCDELWDFIDRETADELVKSGVICNRHNPLIFS